MTKRSMPILTKCSVPDSDDKTDSEYKMGGFVVQKAKDTN